MCRIGTFIPSQMKREDIISVLTQMEGPRTGDGFGFGYVKDGKFVVKKTVLSFSEILEAKQEDKFFGDIFNHNSWVLFHSRNASPSYPVVCESNAHPFVSQNYCMVHNGLFRQAELVRAALGKIEYDSDTDSEVALHFLEKAGRRNFQIHMEDSGVFLFLDKKSNLHVFKTEYIADLKLARLGRSKKKNLFLCSSLPYNYHFDHEEADDGYFCFDNKGNLTENITNNELKDELGKEFDKKIKKYKKKTKVTVVNPKNEVNDIVEVQVENPARIWTGGNVVKSIHEMNLAEWKRFQMEDNSWRGGCE